MICRTIKYLIKCNDWGDRYNSELCVFLLTWQKLWPIRLNTIFIPNWRQAALRKWFKTAARNLCWPRDNKEEKSMLNGRLVVSRGQKASCSLGWKSQKICPFRKLSGKLGSCISWFRKLKNYIFYQSLVTPDLEIRNLLLTRIYSIERRGFCSRVVFF